MSDAPPNFKKSTKIITYFFDFDDFDSSQLFGNNVFSEHNFTKATFTQGFYNSIFAKVHFIIKVLSSADIDSFFVFDEIRIIVFVLDTINGKKSNKLKFDIPIFLTYFLYLFFVNLPFILISYYFVG